MVFKLGTAASKNRRRLKGQNQLPKIINGVKFRNGIAHSSLWSRLFAPVPGSPRG
ncbi:hypothetical protein SAMN06265338_11463 [Rhodoblastus acidophilus]|uniref:Uncharacterized protein n=1 Tax=Rhodoblastus acidophilus TaxID=1074 RepID=A0A212S715_RHOAC|nr:hypothetical protein SAMN06265338_11463 [Rhodoblastus acidophilus]